MFGINDEGFIRSDNIPMTKREIRILAIANARINSESVVVDIGAGTGSITIEAARIAFNGKIFAIEKNPEAIELIKKNIERFSINNVSVMNFTAPEGLEKLPKLNAAIIGGSGGKLEEIVKILDKKINIGGHIVITAITIQTIFKAVEYFKTNNWSYEAIQVQISRLREIVSYNMLKAINPVWVITAKKF